MSQGSWGGGPGGGDGGGYGPPAGGGQPPGGGGGGAGQPPGYGGPPGGGYGQPPGYPPQQGGGFAPPPAGYPPGYELPEVGSVAWEDPNRSFFGRWWATLRDVSFKPREFHRASASNENPWPSITFAVSTNAMMGLLFGSLLGAVYLAIGGATMLNSKASTGPGAPVAAMFSALGVGIAVLYPIMLAAQAFFAPWIQGGIVHLTLSLLRGATKPYANTVRVFGYAHGASVWTIAASFIPLIGPLGGLAVVLISLIVGLDETHKCGMGKAIAAVLLPIALICGCCCALYAGIIGFAATAAHHR